jgi:hypothetical protein
MYPADVPDDASGDPVDAAPDGGDSASYAAEKQAADQEYLDAEAAGIVAAEDPDAAATPATEIFGGLNEYGLAATGDVTPADSTGAIGRSYYVEMVNRQVAVYKRSDLSRVALLGLRDFVTRGRVGHFTVFDPQIMFDAQTNRWYYAADRVDGSKGTNNHLAFGWSKTSDPSNLSSGWCNFITPSTTEFDDYPKLGDNNRFMIVGTNIFTNAINGPPDGSRIWAIRKPLKGVTRCPKRAPHMKRWTVKPSDIEKPLTPVPADTSTSTSNGYVVGADRGDGKLKVWRISGVKTPKLAKVLDISVPSWKVPASVPQPGNDNKLATLDGRLTQAVADVDPAVKRVAVWTQQTVRGNDGRSVVRWYELLPGRKDDPIRQRGTISRSGLFVFNGAVAPATDGTDAVIDFNVGGRKVLAEIHARSRKASTDLGHMVGGIKLGGSTDPDQDFSCSPCRWGDYAGATPDPKRTRVVWGTSEVLGPPSGDKAHWRTRNFALKPG